MSGTTPADAKARAEARFKTPAGVDEPQADGRRIAEAERTALEAKTARLRSLRLAKEESDRIAAEVRRARRQR